LSPNHNRLSDTHCNAALPMTHAGHRSTLPHSLPLKRGMLHYAYSRKMPVQVRGGICCCCAEDGLLLNACLRENLWKERGQGCQPPTPNTPTHIPQPTTSPPTPQPPNPQIIISGNKESVLSEKEMHVGFGCTVVTSYSEMVRAGDYETFDAFMARIQELWDREWLLTMSADAAGAGALAVVRGLCVGEGELCWVRSCRLGYAVLCRVVFFLIPAALRGQTHKQ